MAHCFAQAIAPRYFSTRFIRVFVENVPWLVEKLAIKVLPCVICFVGGVSKDRCVACSVCVCEADPRAQDSWF